MFFDEKKEIDYVYATIHAIIDGTDHFCAIGCYGIRFDDGR